MPTALVTGAAVRVGRAIAEALADAGYDLVLHAHASRAAAEELATWVRARGRVAHVLEADLSAPEGAADLARQALAVAPALDALVNSAAVYSRLAFAELTRTTYEQVMRINLEAPLFLIQGLLPALQAAPSACVVNITDAAVERPYAHHAHYFASKAGLTMLTKTLALELAPKIRVNAVAPGAVAFPEDFSADKRGKVLGRVALGRAGTPRDVAAAVLFLLRDAPYVTGHILAVDGGLSVG